MTLLKVGDYLPIYLDEKLDFRTQSSMNWGAGFRIGGNKAYKIILITNREYHVQGIAFAWVVSIAQVDALIREHRKLVLKQNFSKLFKFFKSK